ncbi:hypothetical protein GQ55_1G132100 [Panicum hallii var. hallii]|uniref:NAC domain-containing protein n=1 Tax=Panicum hallii var. hallii TaxID=1504633 RepID=A0A2T7F552_9POAL|nr:hypothetical protein GQ55_1G132100 [Panicum hallii var. hallii]
MSSVAGMLGLPPGVQFRPPDDELVEFYLLPRARGEPAPFPGVVVVDDDAAGSTLPWELLNRHGRGADDEAYFFVRRSGDGEGQEKPGARQERGCSGSGTWKSQKRLAHGGSRVDDAGEKVHWNRHNLNLHMGRGESGGSVGWVMHEYALTDPSCPPLKICHVAFTGHGKNRKRLPGGGDVDSQSEEPASKRACVPSAGTGGSASSGSGSTTTTVDQDYSSEFMASLPMVQETAGMAELENPYQPMMTQHEFMAPMGVTLGQYCGLSRIGDMEAGAQQDFVEWEGILFY